MVGPATFVVLFLVGLLLLAGVFVLAMSKQRRRRNYMCAECGHVNEAAAQYCGNCGHPL